jgi:hypothetical protein
MLVFFGMSARCLVKWAKGFKLFFVRFLSIVLHVLLPVLIHVSAAVPNLLSMIDSFSIAI